MDFLATLKIIDPKMEGSATEDEICGSFDAPFESDTFAGFFPLPVNLWVQERCQGLLILLQRSTAESK